MNLLNKQNKECKIKIKKPYRKKEPLEPGRYSTLCLRCSITCHINCSCSKNKKIKDCCVMNSKGFCSSCPNKCNWRKHAYMPYILKNELIEVKENIDLGKSYFYGEQKPSIYDQVISGMELELEKIMKDCYYIKDEVKDCLKTIKTQAPHPKITETDEYINILIQYEDSYKKPGYQDRIKALESKI